MTHTKRQTRSGLRLHQEARYHEDGGWMGERKVTIIPFIKPLIDSMYGLLVLLLAFTIYFR